jgi:hypothetical protein
MPDGSKKTKKCFVIGPIGTPDSETRIHADWLLEEIIEPVFSEFPEFDVVRADKISQPGMIDAQVIQNLFDADIVIADLSKLNANAFYEIGIRHMHQKPIIHMQLADDEIPFDVSLYRAIKFSRVRPSDLRKAKEDLKRAVQATLASNYTVDNPITRARGQIKLVQDATPPEKVLLEQLKAIQYRLDQIENRPVPYEGIFSIDSDDDFYRDMKSATTITFVFPANRTVDDDIFSDVISHIPSANLKSAHRSNNEITVQTTPGFMVTKGCDAILHRIRSKYKLRNIRYIH